MTMMMMVVVVVVVVAMVVMVITGERPLTLSRRSDQLRPPPSCGETRLVRKR